MPSNSELYSVVGIDGGILPFPNLTFLLRTDPMIGSCSTDVPDGPFNRELHKLLKNDGALASLIVSIMRRTFGSSSNNAPTLGTIPSVIVGATNTPLNYQIHTVFYADYEITYRYNSTLGAWEELVRQLREFNNYKRYFKKVTYTMQDNESSIVVELPTTDQNGDAFEFTLEDLRTYYVKNVNAGSGLISVLPAIVEGNDSFIMTATAAPTNGADYQLVCIFERFVTI